MSRPPSARIQPRASILSCAEAAALARQVITPYSDCVLKPGSDPNAKSRVLEVLAQIDPDKAWRKCQAGEAPWNHNAVRIVAVRQFADRDPEDAQAILPTITSEFWRNWTRFELIDRLPAARVERKVALLTEAVLDARRAGDPGAKVSKLMKAAGRFLDLGRDTEARKLVEEALPLARTVDASGHRLGSTRQVVANLARLDLNAALALIPAQGDERTSNDFRGLIAQHIAAANPAEAERLLNAMTRNNSPTYAVKAWREWPLSTCPDLAGSPRQSISTWCGPTPWGRWLMRWPGRIGRLLVSCWPNRFRASAR